MTKVRLKTRDFHLPKIKMGKTIVDGTIELGRLIAKGIAVKCDLEINKAALDEINKQVVDYVKDVYLQDKGTVHITVDDCGECTVRLTDKVKIVNLKAIQNCFTDAEAFRALVKEKVEYSATERLIEIACDGDHPNHEEVRNAVEIETGKPAVTWKPS